MPHRYFVTTWDVDKEAFTPQPGVRKGPYTLFGLRKAILKLRDGGYPCNYGRCAGYGGDPSVLVERGDGGWNGSAAVPYQGELFQ